MAAIYMWFQRDVQVLTTTLYPLEVVDAVQFSFDIEDASMSLIPQDELGYSADLLGVTLTEILLTYGPLQDQVYYGADLLAVSLNTILLTHGPVNDELFISSDLLDVNLISLLVTVDTPDEKLQLDFDINATGWHMTPV